MINLRSTVRLASGYTMPRLGFGVYQSIDAKASVLEALKAGYRLFEHRSLITYLVSHLYTDMSTLLSTIKMKQKWQRPLGFQEYLEKIFLSVSVEIITRYSCLSRALLQPLNVCQAPTDMNQLLEVSTSR